MEPKMKKISAVVLIAVLVLVGIFIGYFFSQKNAQIKTGDKIQEYGPVFIDGVVVNSDESKLEIISGNSTIERIFNQGVFIYTKEEGNIFGKEIGDLKVGTKVKVELDTQKQVIMSVEILK